MKRILLAVAAVGVVAVVAVAQPRGGPGGGGPGGGPGGERRASRAGPLPAAEVNIEIRPPYRYVTSNGIANHEVGQFPNRNNPNSISAQQYAFRMPLKPTSRPVGTAVRRGLVGVALNGVVFDPGTAEAWKNDPRSGWNIEAIPPAGVRSMNLGLDSSNAHVQPTGAYHYHAIPVGLVAALGGVEGKMVLMGYAADGFPMYASYGPTDATDLASPMKKLLPSYRIKTGTRPGGDAGPGGAYDGTYTQDYEYVAGLGDLDEANGRTGVTPEYPEGTYHYVLTEGWPYIPRELKGTIDPSFANKGGPPGGRGPGGGGPGGGGPGGQGRPGGRPPGGGPPPGGPPSE